MNKKQLELFEKLTELEQRFIINILNGEKRPDAYKNAGAESESYSAIHVNSYRMFHKEKVKAFYNAVMDERLKKAKMTKDKFIQRLELMFCNELPGEQVTIPNQLSAGKQLAEIHGWNAPLVIETDQKEQHDNPVEAAAAFKEKILNGGASRNITKH